MNIAELRRDLEKLNKILEIMEVSKFNTIQKLKNAIKISDTLTEISLIARSVIMFSTEKYKIKNKVSKTIKNDSTVFVFITLPKSLLSTSYDKYEKMIISSFRKGIDKLIAIGGPAIEFASKQKIQPVYSAQSPDNSINNVSSILTGLHLKEEINKIAFVSTSPKVATGPAVVMPLDQVNFGNESFDNFIDKKYKFYPSIIEDLEKLSSLYISRISRAFLQEAKVYFLKDKLVRHEESINSINDLITKKNKALKKEKRKIETEDLIFMNQIAKNGGGHA